MTEKEKNDLGTEYEKMMDNCTLCPRKCGVNRNAGQVGYCRVGSEIRIGRAALHLWEEPCLTGEQGAGAIFFAGCNLGCVYCQNYRISAGEASTAYSVSELAGCMMKLQEEGAACIDLVTPTHYVPQICAALQLAKQRGLHIPVVYNSSGYEEVAGLKLLEGLVDIYMPDFKYCSSVLSGQYSHAPDYFETAKKALDEMVRQTGEPEFDEKGIMRKGVLVRHLVLPEQTADSKAVIEYLYQTYGDRIYMSILNQYTPLKRVESLPPLNRKITEEEYEAVVDFAIELGVENGFIQEGETADESFIPEFGGE